MALTQQRKQEIMGDFQTHETDTGSADVQIAMLSDRISKLSAHLKINQKDFASRRGLMMMISRRKRLLAYLQKENVDRYKALIARLGIRG
ncbi:MAG: 30S ribosomal protein S15 [Microcoleus sp. PH2017_29_MFU_D_A]|jgi:small subunit ribosomal protein S15|uniref:30S ribosomal protein S15 n=1 Tax=unclassified Microcoleus TaxID=2642155 RepID=UPI001E016201|nr:MULTISPECIES: 30S ribosomal protein S15 [unclassified Microcoleus]MCC3431344.1 30S ribosomal protein S15 [Microcoleus sp. PH2017_04_SCI_O_A]MCC3444769.1 30S ribosomal protein S15 [Microcoleus sp. PH2017_03_ELD_O_A]MCC3468758.1 30S ribosomal protein S15 [Microcoleus sp. PH2017_06_SFM_O_A]MCC3504885.1 30S ribosomal protein S15 [Microcoleus sp. PH2017_19_SFW_U_A]MCC3510861.1 30S ribosomal protein S15 [Microcoleus sp. PH2017_17_BER_D_A]TAE08654.1 MAG: 30S ribosomal protein S15 [Oscillatoriales